MSGLERQARALALLLPLAACAGAPPSVAGAPALDPISFFAGTSEGRGTLKVVFRSPVPVAVHSRGTVDRAGELTLVQRIEEGRKPERTRTWRMRPAGPGRWTGTLTDATGPVTVEQQPGRIHIAYPAGGVRIEQWLTLAPDGRTAANRLVARKFGVTVATLDETIRRLD